MSLKDLLEKLLADECLSSAASKVGVPLSSVEAVLREVAVCLESRDPGAAVAYVDGASSGNPGDAGIGVVLRTPDGTNLEISEYIGKTTNNVAEYRALLKALKTARDLKASSVTVYSDSELLVKQMNGEYAVRNDTLRALHDEALEIMKSFDKCDIIHVGRQNNRLADRLAKKASLQRME